MEIERDTVIEIAISVSAVLLFVAVILAIAVTYGEDGVLGEEGGLMLVGAIALFIVLMTGVGYWLSGRET